MAVDLRCNGRGHKPSYLSGSVAHLTRDVDELYIRMTQRQEQHLIPLKEDVADWLNKTLDVDDITANNFMAKLDNGVIVCRLASLLQARAEHCRREGIISQPVPPFQFKCWENAKSGSFFARDNTENFLRWCRKFGVNEAVMFESDGLVLHSQARSVVLCLLELGRMASKFGVEPPGLVKLEKEIEEQELLQQQQQGSFLSTDSDRSSACSSPLPPLSRAHSNLSDSSGHAGTPPPAKSGQADELDAAEVPAPPSPVAPEETFITNGSSHQTLEREEDVDSGVEGFCGTDSLNSSLVSAPSPPPESATERRGSFKQQRRQSHSELDQKVRKIASRVCHTETQIKRISEGRYCIGGRIYFVRLLKEKHVMIRVGGGWDTLEHFLSRHDTCNVILLNRRSSITSDDGASSTCSGSSSSSMFGSPSPLSSGPGSPTSVGQSRPRYRSPASSVSLTSLSSLSKHA